MERNHEICAVLSIAAAAIMGWVLLDIANIISAAPLYGFIIGSFWGMTEFAWMASEYLVVALTVSALIAIEIPDDERYKGTLRGELGTVLGLTILVAIVFVAGSGLFLFPPSSLPDGPTFEQTKLWLNVKTMVATFAFTVLMKQAYKCARNAGWIKSAI